MHLRLPVDAGIIERCLVEMSRRHESLRTTFHTMRGVLYRAQISSTHR